MGEKDGDNENMNRGSTRNGKIQYEGSKTLDEKPAGTGSSLLVGVGRDHQGQIGLPILGR